MSFFTRERIDLAVHRTNEQYNDAKRYAFQNSVQASVIVGTALLLALYFPASVVFTLCVSALALICFNLCKEPSMSETASMAFNFS